MIRLTVTVTNGQKGRLMARTFVTPNATWYAAEFPDSPTGVPGIVRFLGMLRYATGQPVKITTQGRVQTEAIRDVIRGKHPPVRYDGRYGEKEQQKREAADEDL